MLHSVMLGPCVLQCVFAFVCYRSCTACVDDNLTLQLSGSVVLSPTLQYSVRVTD